MPALSQRLTESLGALRAAARNRDLQRLQLAYAGSAIGQWAGSVAITVFAFEAAGPRGVGLQIVLRMVPSALVAPFAATLADRYRRERVMVASDLLGVAITVAMAGLVLADAQYVLVLVAAGARGIVATAFQPAKSALLPTLADEADELTAANVISSTIESLSIFVGPALGGLLLAATSVPVVLAVTALALLWSALLVSRIDVRREREATADPAPPERLTLRSFLAQTAEGFRAVAGSPPVRLVVGLITAQTLLDGMLGVLLVTASIDLLDMGRSGLGILNSAVGVGGVLGAVAAAALVGRRLAPAFALGILLWGLPIIVLGLVPSVAVALAALAALGIGNTLTDVSGFTLLQRAAPDEVLGRVFGILESLILASIAVGGVLAAGLVSWVGIEAALVIAGAFLPVVVAVCWPRLARVDADAADTVSPADVALLRGVPMFAVLGPEILDDLAAKLRPSAAAAGEEVVRQGDGADRFYIIAAGHVDVLVDGRPVREQGPGDSFGEIGLLRDVPRTATVRARTPVELRTLDRDAFLAAVTGHAPSREAADAVVAARLGRARPALPAV